MKSAIPDRITILHQGEEVMRERALDIISANTDYTMHLQMIEQCQNIIHYHVHSSYEDTDLDGETIRYLGIRQFNSISSSLLLILAGYGQSGTALMRDVLEVSFLLTYFRSDLTLIKSWRESNEKERLDNFKPVVVRTKIDELDGFTEQRRKKHYQLLCELAVHPTFAGFDLIKPDGKAAHCGPFMGDKTLGAFIAELAKVALVASAGFMDHFPLNVETTTKGDLEERLEFEDMVFKWSKYFFGEPSNEKSLQVLKDVLSRQD